MVVFALTVVMSGAGLAQRMPTVPLAGVAEHRELDPQARIRYILRQLNLSDEQIKHARGLLRTIFDDTLNPPLSIGEVHALVAELQVAQKEDDQERIEELEAQLRELGRGHDREAELIMNLEPVLTDAQKEVLTEVRARLKRNPSGALRPIDIFRAAHPLELSKAQRARLDKLHERFRLQMCGFRNKRIDDETRFQLINGLIELIKAELKPEQVPDFELNVRRLRPDLAYRLRTKLPDKQSAGEEEKTQQELEGGEEETDPTNE
jgi:hypothetical protein